MNQELKKLQKEIAEQLLTDEQFIEATLQAMKDMKIHIQKPARVAMS